MISIGVPTPSYFEEMGKRSANEDNAMTTTKPDAAGFFGGFLIWLVGVLTWAAAGFGPTVLANAVWRTRQDAWGPLVLVMRLEGSNHIVTALSVLFVLLGVYFLQNAGLQRSGGRAGLKVLYRLRAFCLGGMVTLGCVLAPVALLYWVFSMTPDDNRFLAISALAVALALVAGISVGSGVGIFQRRAANPKVWRMYTALSLALALSPGLMLLPVIARTPPPRQVR
jgi:hypothetical protein